MGELMELGNIKVLSDLEFDEYLFVSMESHKSPVKLVE